MLREREAAGLRFPRMLRVRLLGDLTLEVDGGAIDLPASRRARSLLGWLALERRMHARSALAARFWPDVLDESARTSLRSALSALRRALGPDGERYVIATRDDVGLAGERVVWTDVAEFDRCLAEARAGSPTALGRLFDSCSAYLQLIARQQLPEALQPKLGGSDVVQEALAAGCVHHLAVIRSDDVDGHGFRALGEDLERRRRSARCDSPDTELGRRSVDLLVQ